MTTYRFVEDAPTPPPGKAQFRFVDKSQRAPVASVETPPMEPPQPIERIGRGVADFTEGITQAALSIKDAITGGQSAQDYTADKSNDLALYEQGRGQGAGVDWWRLMGNVASTAPAMLVPGAAGLGARTAIGAGTGAATAGVMFTPEGQSKPAQIGVGAVFGAAAPAVASAISSAVGRLAQAGRQAWRGLTMPKDAQIAGELQVHLTNAGIDWKRLAPEMQAAMLRDAKAQLQATGNMSADAIARRQDINAVAGDGMATRAQVSRNPADWTRERNLSKVTESGAGERIVERYQQQDAGMQNFTGRVTNKVGGKPSTPFQASEDAIGRVVDRWRETGDDVSGAYDLARQAFGTQAKVSINTFGQRAAQALNDFEDALPAPIVRRIQEFGLTRNGVVKPSREFTVEEGDKLLKLINSRYKATNDPAVKEGLNQLRGALKDAVLELGNGGNDAANAFAQAWKEAAGRFEEFTPRPIAAAVEGKADPSRFISQYVTGGNPNDLAALAKTLQAAPNGPQTWNTLRGQVWDTLISEATQQGRGAFSGAAFDRALNKIGLDRLRILFPDVIDDVLQLRRASLAMTSEPSFSAVNRSNTASTLANWALRYAPDMPVVGPLVAKPVQSAVQNVQASRALTAPLVDDAALSAAREAEVMRLRDLLNRGGRAAAGPAGYQLTR